MINAAWFRSKLADQGKSQRQLARFMRTEPANITRIFNGTRRLQIEECKQIARFLGVPVDQVLKNAGVDFRNPVESLPVVPIAGYSDGLHVFMESGENLTTDTTMPPDILALRIKAPMQPHDGWTLFFQQSKQRPELAVGRIVIAHNVGGYLLGVIKRSYEAGQFDVLPLWGEQVAAVMVDHVLPVIWIRPA